MKHLKSSTYPLIQKALHHVTTFHPSVTKVRITTEGWIYTDPKGNSPTFGDEIDQMIIDEAYDSVSHLSPAIFKLN